MHFTVEGFPKIAPLHSLVQMERRGSSLGQSGGQSVPAARKVLPGDELQRLGMAQPCTNGGK